MNNKIQRTNNIALNARKGQYLRWLPNAITFSRAVLALLAFCAALQQHWAVGFWLLLGALTTDFFDGLAARKLNVQSKFGEELDALTDGFVVVLGVLSLGVTGHLAWWIIVAILGVGFLIGSDRFFNQPVWEWRAVVAVASLFMAWIGIVWVYAYLAFGWSWLYVPITLIILLCCAVLKRQRIRAWLPSKDKQKHRLV